MPLSGHKIDLALESILGPLEVLGKVGEVAQLLSGRLVDTCWGNMLTDVVGWEVEPTGLVGGLLLGQPALVLGRILGSLHREL